MKSCSFSLPAVFCAALFAVAASSAHADTLTVTTQNQATSSVSSYVNTFNNAAAGTTSPLQATFGTSGVTGTYSGSFAITTQTPYGGAAGGNYITTGGNSPAPGAPAFYTLTLSSNVSYFGFYLGALDSGNQLSLYNNGAAVGSISNSQLVSAFSSCSGCTNPADSSGQKYGFVNVTDTNGSFNQIQFTENPYSGQNFESDNHTIGGIAATPEPNSLMLLGTGMAGVLGAARRRFLKK